MSAPPAAALPGAIVLDASDDAPLALPSVCMKCFKNVRQAPRERGGGGEGGERGGVLA